MPFIRSLASKRYTYIVAVIFLLSEIMPTYSRYMLKGLVYIIIIAPLSRQPFSCIKCTKLNMRLSCDIRLVFNAKCTCLIYFCILRSLRLLYLIALGSYIIAAAKKLNSKLLAALDELRCTKKLK